ncbi:MAG: hypothetical protein Q4C70_15890, partial [Planctomycetia bacterium]|nr:hypothetical protein [Planctomycetia bacterium]
MPKNMESDTRRAFYSRIAQELRTQIPVDRAYHGPGEVWVEFTEQNGFTAWITRKGVHSVELTFLVPYVHSLTGENQLKIQFPYATMSEMKLRIPQTRNESERLAVSMTGGTTLDTPYFVQNRSAEETDSTKKTSAEENGVTYVSAIRLGGELWLSWSVSPQEKTATPDILEAEGLILAVIGKNAVTYDARLKILRKNNDINTLRLRLPTNAELLPSNTADYSVAVVQIPEDVTQRGPVAEITLKKPQTGLIRIDIHAKVPIQTGNEDADWFNMAGFEFLSAVRQSGYYAIKTTSGKHANWTPGAGMRRLEELPV